MSEWKEYRLGELGIVVTGKTPSSNNPEDWGCEMLFVTPSDYRNYCKYAGVSERQLSSIGIQRLEKKVLPRDSILVTCIGTIGNVVMAKTNCITNQQINAIIPNDYIVDAHYLYYKLVGMRDVLLALGSNGSVVSILNKGDFEKINISLPPMEEQKRIAGILSALDDKIELNRRINANLELQAQTLFNHWFVDFEFPNADGKPYKSSGGKLIDSPLGPIPEGWETGDIYNYVNVIYGAPYKSSLFNSAGKGLPLIRIRDLKSATPQFYTEEILPNTEYINIGDIVAGMDAEFVPHIWRGRKGVLNQRVCKLVPRNDDISNIYVLYLMKPELEFVQSYKVGTTVSHLGKSDIDRFNVIIPPIEIVKKFSNIGDALLEEMKKLSLENMSLADLRDTLLPKLMNDC